MPMIADSRPRNSSRAFRCVVGIFENFFANDALRGFIQVGEKCSLKLQILGPERSINKCPWGADDQRAKALPLVAVGNDSVSAAKGGEQPPLPLIRYRKPELRHWFGPGRGPQRLTDAVNGSSGSLTLASSRCAFKQRSDLAQFLAELLLSGHYSD